jgi:UDP-N-acetylmuramate--alanine ligase
MKLADIKKIHFIGIGGIGASALAQILHVKKKIISGSDQTKSKITDSLEKSGIAVNIGHNENQIPKGSELIVYSHAIPQNNPELTKAKKLNIPAISYPQALSLLTQDFFTIAITGTHGKSTTTAMTALTLIDAGLDPTVIVGTKLKEFNNQNYRVGKSKYLVIEACEYKSSFLELEPEIVAITNIEAEHLDHFKTFENYKDTFKTFTNKLPKSSKIILNGEDKLSHEVSAESKAEVITWNAIINFPLKVPGNFNKENASFAQAIAKELKVTEEEIKNSLQNFNGTWRRCEYKTVENLSPQFIDDYGHHPTEVKLTLEAIREKNPEDRILCVFQPHQYSRTFRLLKEFGKSFNAADQTIIPNIYQVRDSEEDIQSVSVKDLVSEIEKNGSKAKDGEGLKNTAKIIREIQDRYDIVITMGAGNITSIYNLL